MRRPETLRGAAWLPLLLTWLGVATLLLLLRVPLAVDETRALTIAWEMQLQSGWLLPTLNGEPYTAQPPLLFWLIRAGWAIVGTHDAWPRLIPLLAGLLAAGITWQLARQLWPQLAEARPLASLLAGGALLWILASTWILPELVLTLWVLAGMLGLIRASNGHDAGFLLLGVALGLGLLTQGAVTLLHLGLPAMLAPLWSTPVRDRSWRWYGGLLASLALGLGIAAAWAVPAALEGGASYLQGLVAAVDAQQWWWYLPWVPVLLLPWTLWPAAWRALPDGTAGLDPGARLCLAWIVPVALALTVVGERQPQALLPLLVPVALLLARGLAMAGRPSYRENRLPAVLPALLAGALLAAARWVPGDWHRGWLEDVHPGWGGAILLAAAWAWLPHRLEPLVAVLRLHVASVLAIVLATTALLGSAAGRAYGVAPMALDVAARQEEGVVVAYYGTYSGQLGHAGRLEQPLEILAEWTAMQGFAARQPAGVVLLESRRNPLLVTPPVPLSVSTYRGGFWSLWPARALAADATLPRRIDVPPG